MVNKNLAIPGVRCQTLGLKIPGSDYIGDADHTVSGKPCVQWNLAALSSVENNWYPTNLESNFGSLSWLRFDRAWRKWTHNKCRNSGDDDTAYRAPDGAFCFIADGFDSEGNQKHTLEGCHQIPGISFALILIIKLD